MKKSLLFRKTGAAFLLVILLLCMGAGTVFADSKVMPTQEVTSSLTKGQGIHVYTLPSGPKGYEEESVWFYTEMIGRDQKPYMEEGWAVKVTLTHSSAANAASTEEGEAQTDEDPESTSETGESSEEESTTSGGEDKTYDLKMLASENGFYSKKFETKR